MNEHVRNNHYLSSTKGFRDAISEFFSQTLPSLVCLLTARINDNSQALEPAS